MASIVWNGSVLVLDQNLSVEEATALTKFGEYHAEQERNRIIKLLEDSKCECASLSVEDWVKSITERGNFLKHVVCGSEADTIDEAIALIKGENK